jgi:hypothetical protein
MAYLIAHVPFTALHLERAAKFLDEHIKLFRRRVHIEDWIGRIRNANNAMPCGATSKRAA